MPGRIDRPREGGEAHQIINRHGGGSMGHQTVPSSRGIPVDGLFPFIES